MTIFAPTIGIDDEGEAILNDHITHFCFDGDGAAEAVAGGARDPEGRQGLRQGGEVDDGLAEGLGKPQRQTYL